MIDNKFKLNRFGIYYVPRKFLEDGISNKIKRLKKLRNKKENKEDIDQQLEKLNAKRPCIILKKYNANLTLIPITKSNADVSHIETKVFNRDYKSYIKTSVLVTISVSRFREVSDMFGNKKLPQEEIDNLLHILNLHYLT